jgi:hypothetical protein
MCSKGQSISTGKADSGSATHLKPNYGVGQIGYRATIEVIEVVGETGLVYQTDGSGGDPLHGRGHKMRVYRVTGRARVFRLLC